MIVFHGKPWIVKFDFNSSFDTLRKIRILKKTVYKIYILLSWFSYKITINLSSFLIVIEVNR